MARASHAQVMAAGAENAKRWKVALELMEQGLEVSGSTSDGHHTFDELYRFRLLYNAALFNEWAKKGVHDVHKSLCHSDGEKCFGGRWFVVMAELPTGQISNHYSLKDWDLFKVPDRKVANEWDGHTADDVAERLTSFLV